MFKRLLDKICPTITKKFYKYDFTLVLVNGDKIPVVSKRYYIWSWSEFCELELFSHKSITVAGVTYNMKNVLNAVKDNVEEIERDYDDEFKIPMSIHESEVVENV